MDSRVEKWRDIASREISQLGVPLPVEHILAIIQRESGGTAGAVNASSGASGLMQVMAIALKDYNQNHERKFTMDQLRGHDTGSAAIQIRVGTWILSRFLKGAYRYLKPRLGTVPLDDLIKVTDTFYAAGPGNAKSRLNQINRPNWIAIKSRFPNWDRIRPAELVWERANDGGAQWNLPAIDSWLEGEAINDHQIASNGAIIGLLIIAAAWAWLQRSEK